MRALTTGLSSVPMVAGLTAALLLSCSGSPKSSHPGTGGAPGTGTGGSGTGGADTGGAGGQNASGGAGSGGTPGSGGNAGGDVGTGGARSGGAGGGEAGTGGTATGGAAGGGGGGAMATGGGPGGTGGSPSAATWCTPPSTIDKFEDGTGKICQTDGRSGNWFSYRDPTSTLSPPGNPTVPSTLDPPRDDSRRALHVTGTFVQYAGFGCSMKPAPATYNASAFAGLQFYLKGTASAPTVIVQTSATESTTYGGQCTLAPLSCAGNTAPLVGVLPNDWTLFKIPFSTLANGTSPFNSADVWSIEFQPGPGVFDLWLDDLSFY